MKVKGPMRISAAPLIFVTLYLSFSCSAHNLQTTRSGLNPSTPRSRGQRVQSRLASPRQRSESSRLQSRTRASSRTSIASLSTSAVSMPQQRKQPQEPTEVEVAFLIGAAALWGTYPSAIKSFFASSGSAISAGEVTLIRFMVMAIASSAALTITSDDVTKLDSSRQQQPLPWLEQVRRRVPSSVYLAAFELGAIGLIGSYCNTLGLQQIPAQSGAVLLGFLNIFTPILASAIGATETERKVDLSTWLCSFAVLAASTYALFPDESHATSTSGLVDVLDFTNMLPTLPSVGAGEIQVLSAAFLFAVAKVRLSSHLKVHSPEALTAGRLVAQAGLAAVGLGLTDETHLLHELLPTQQGGVGTSLMDAMREYGNWFSDISLQQVWWLVSSALLSGSIATWCQTKGQAAIAAPTAQLFYSTTPLFGAIWASLLLKEQITQHELVGGAILLLSIGTTSLITEPLEEQEEEEDE